MQRYVVKLLRYKDCEVFIIHLSAECAGEAYSKALNFLYTAYGIYCYYLVSLKKEWEI